MARIPPPFPPRNDVPAAIAYARYLVEVRQWDDDMERVLLLHQDDPLALAELLAEVVRETTPTSPTLASER